MAEVKFTIKRYNGTTFDIALPKTVVEQVIEINEHLKDGDRHISAEDREVLKTVATLSAKGYAPIRNSAMATVKEYPTYTALKNDLANLPQGTTAMVLDASDDVLVDYGYAMYRVMLDDTDNKTLIKVSDTMSMDFVLKLDNVRGFNQSAEAVDKMVEDSHFHDNFALLNTLTQGMFEGLKDYQKAKTAFENTLDKVGLRSGDMAFVKVGNDPTVPTEEEHTPGPVVPPVSEDTHTEQPQPPVAEETHTEQPATPLTPGENTVTPQPEGTGETHTETEPVAPAPVEETHTSEENKPVAEETPASPEPNVPQPPVSEDTHTETPVATGETQPVNTPEETHTETSNPEEHKEEEVSTEHPVANEGQPATPVPSEGTPTVAPESGTPDSTEHPVAPAVTPEENKPVTPQPEAEANPPASENTHTEQPVAPVAEDTRTEVTPANPVSGTEEKHEGAPVGEDAHTEQPAAPVAPEETHENTESPVVKPEDNTVVTPQPEAPVSSETPVNTGDTHTEDPAVNTGESHSEESSGTPAVGTEENNVVTPVAEEPVHTEVTPPPTPAVPEEHAHSETTENSEGTPVVNTEDTSGDTPKPATPDDERFNSHLAVQPKPVENDLPEGVSPTSGNN